MRSGRDIKLEDLASLLAHRIAGLPGDSRVIVALAGPPGAGKSTCAVKLSDLVNASGKGRSSVLQMDGYHLDDSILIARGLRSRKGAPETFDVPGLRAVLDRLRRNEESEIAVPQFDRSLELSRAGALMIHKDSRLLIVEGNYLLLDRKPWSDLRPYFDVTVSVRASDDTLRARLYARWREQGINATDIPAKVESNDMPNANLVLANSMSSDFVLQT